MKRIAYSLTVVLVVFVFISFFDVPLSDRVAEIFFGMCSVFFSVGMSLIICFDFSKIIDEESYTNYTKGLAKIRISFIIQFIIACTAFIFFQLLGSKDSISISINLKGKRFSADTFLSLIVIYSLFFFLYNFHLLTKEKTKLDKRIRDEILEDQE